MIAAARNPLYSVLNTHMCPPMDPTSFGPRFDRERGVQVCGCGDTFGDQSSWWRHVEEVVIITVMEHAA